jgi:hypothetical protein
VARATHVLLLIGLPVSLVLGWYHGEKGRQRVSGPDLVIIAALLFVAGGLLGMLAPGPLLHWCVIALGSFAVVRAAAAPRRRRMS